MNGVLVGSRCQLGRCFTRCKNPPSHTCQYCGRDFCSAHSYLVEGLDEICSGRVCQAKQRDLAAHQQYLAAVERRNHVGLCGIEDCVPHPGLECSICKGLFCDAHLKTRMYPFHDGRIVSERRASVCAHCWGRRKLWRRRR